MYPKLCELSKLIPEIVHMAQLVQLIQYNTVVVQ